MQYPSRQKLPFSLLSLPSISGPFLVCKNGVYQAMMHKREDLKHTLADMKEISQKMGFKAFFGPFEVP